MSRRLGWVTGHLHYGILLDKLLEPCCHYHITLSYDTPFSSVCFKVSICVGMGEHIGADVAMSTKLFWGHGKGTRMRLMTLGRKLFTSV